MVGKHPIRDVTVLVTLYLLLSVPPYLYFNRELSVVRSSLALIAILGTVFLVLVSGLLVAREGVMRFVRFLLNPTDLFSVFVEVSFGVAAVSWWLLPEVVASTALDLQLATVLTVIVLCHLPLVLLLSLMTVVGDSKKLPY